MDQPAHPGAGTSGLRVSTTALACAMFLGSPLLVYDRMANGKDVKAKAIGAMPHNLPGNLAMLTLLIHTAGSSCRLDGTRYISKI